MLWSLPGILQHPLVSLPYFPAVKCLQPPNIPNGKVRGNTSGSFPSGAEVWYSCNPGYSLLGSAVINCTASGTWSRPLPQCKGESGSLEFHEVVPQFCRTEKGIILRNEDYFLEFKSKVLNNS